MQFKLFIFVTCCSKPVLRRFDSVLPVRCLLSDFHKGVFSPVIAIPASVTHTPTTLASMIRLGVRVAKLGFQHPPSLSVDKVDKLELSKAHATPVPRHYTARYTEFLKPTMAERLAAFESPEFEKAFDGAYDLAETRLLAQVTAEKDRCQRAGIPYKGLPGVVLLDIDETTLSNNRFYRDEIAKGPQGMYGDKGRDPKKVTAFDQHRWDAAITGNDGQKPMGEVIPRAKAFIDFCEANGINYAFASGRSRIDSNEDDQLPPTRAALKAGGMIGEHCQGIYLKPLVDIASNVFKARVREQLEAKLKGPIQMCIGDQPSTDFLAETPESAGKNIQLPNAFYRWDVKEKPVCHVHHKARPLSTLYAADTDKVPETQWSTVA